MKRQITLITFCFIASLLCAQHRNPLQVIEKQLSNGMQVWLNEDHTRPQVFGAVVVKAGSKDSPNTGIAHYFEHIMFKGTDKIGTVDYLSEKPWLDSIATKYDELANTKDAIRRSQIQKDINRLSRKAGEYAIPNEFETLIQKFGGTGLNAYTSTDETVYYNFFLPHYIDQWCELNSERLISPVFRLFQGELEAVYEEKNRASDDVFRSAMDDIQRHIFAGTPYAYPIIGSTESIKNPQLSAMSEFYQRYYVAGNMGLVLCGDIDADAIMPLLERTFGRIRPGKAPISAPTHLPSFTNHDVFHVKLPVPVVKIAGYVLHAPTNRDPDYVPFTLALALLSNSEGTGLLDSLSNSHRVMMATAGQMSFKDVAVAYFGYVPKLPFGSRKTADRLCRKQIEKLKYGQFTDQALEVIKQNSEKKRQLRLEGIDTRRFEMINAMSHGLTWSDYLQQDQDLMRVTKTDIVRVINRYFNGDYMQVVKRYGSNRKEKVAQPDYRPVTPKYAGTQSSYAKALEQQSVKAVMPRLPDFDHDVKTVQMAPLVTFYSVPNPVNDLFKLQLIYHKGRREDNRLTAVADYLSLIGTYDLPLHRFRKALGELGASIDFEAGNDAFTITLSGFDRHLVPSLALLRQLMTRAKADPRMMKDLIHSARIDQKTFFKVPVNITNAVINRVIYGSRSPYLTQLTASQLKKMDGEALINIFKSLQTNELSIAYSGRLNVDSVTEAVRRHVDLRQVTVPHSFTHRPLMTYDRPAVYFYDVPTARQTTVCTYLSLPAMPTEQARARFALWSQYFGSGMSSILFQDIREFRALAYAVNGQRIMPSIIAHRDDPTGYLAYLGTQSDKTMQAIGVLDSLFSAMPLRESGMAAARQGVINRINNDYPDFRDMARDIALWRMAGYSAAPDKALSELLPHLSLSDIMSFYTNYVRKVPRVLIVVGNKRMLDMQKLATFGPVIELKKQLIVGHR